MPFVYALDQGGTPTWNIPTVLGASSYCCIFLWRGSDQCLTFLPADEFHAQSFVSTTGPPPLSPYLWGVGPNVHLAAAPCLPLLSLGFCLTPLRSKQPPAGPPGSGSSESGVSCVAGRALCSAFQSFRSQCHLPGLCHFPWSKYCSDGTNTRK